MSHSPLRPLCPLQHSARQHGVRPGLVPGARRRHGPEASQVEVLLPVRTVAREGRGGRAHLQRSAGLHRPARRQERSAAALLSCDWLVSISADMGLLLGPCRRNRRLHVCVLWLSIRRSSHPLPPELASSLGPRLFPGVSELVCFLFCCLFLLLWSYVVEANLTHWTLTLMTLNGQFNLLFFAYS